jgi:putative redox protein
VTTNPVFCTGFEITHYAAEQNVHQKVAALNRALLILHSPVDETVTIGNATGLFVNAKHPKSFACW